MLNSSMRTRIATIHFALALCLLLVAGGCSDSSDHSGAQCPPGTQLNEITGECKTAGRQDRGDAGWTNSDTGTQPGPGSDTGTPGPRPDAGTPPGPSNDAGHPSYPDVPENPDCQGNERRCYQGNVQTCRDGQFELSEQCREGFLCERGNCIPGEGYCQPQSRQCATPTSYQVCGADGRTYGAPVQCPQGSTCQSGQCLSSCAGSLNEKSNLGCQYLTMRMDQASGMRTLPHTVVVSNPGTSPATVSISSPGISGVNMPDQTIQPQQSAILNFPTSPMINQPGLSDKIYLINTSNPVIATQFAPLNNPGIGSETSDAHLLLPTNALGTEHIVLGWPGPPGMGGFPGVGGMGSAGTYIDVIAVEDGTTVQVSGPRALSGGQAGSMAANSTQTFSIPRHNVLHLAENGGMFGGGDTDLSGTILTSNKPVAVYVGATIVNIPNKPVASPAPGCAAKGATCVTNSNCCSGICGHNYANGRVNTWECMDSLSAGDHLEQQLFPVESWGTSYVATPFFNRGINDFAIFKITAARNQTTVTLNPAVNGVSSLTLNRGEVRQFHTADAFEIQANNPISVAQFMIGGTTSPSGNGDPAFLLPPAIQHFRSSYVFLVPNQYLMNFVTLIAPTGLDITLDGNTIPASSFTPLGGQGTWSYKIIDSISGGVHRASAAQPFGVVVHGMDNYISYAFSGGIILPN